MLRGFVLGVILLAVVGVCTVMETSKQTQARYRLNELDRRENEMRRRLAKLHTEEQKLRSPSRLAQLARDARLELVALGSAVPQVAGGRVRQPGQVLDDPPAQTALRQDESGNGAGVDMHVAVAGQW